MGVQTITAAGGAEGIELARRHRPETILMDLRMTGMDGIEATRRLQADAATASIPVLAVTASPFEDARAVALAAGCREFLAKPVRAADLIGALERQLGARFERSVTPAPPIEEQVNDLHTSAALAAVADRLREATAIGSISDLHAIVQELIKGDPQQARLGHRIARWVDQFEFEAIERLASGGAIDGDRGAK
jgi:CheY-like chemotaxis protein